MPEEIPFANINSENISDEKIFFDFLNFIKRNFRIIVATSSIFFLIGVSYSLFLQKRLWEGQLQIVLSSNKTTKRNVFTFSGRRADNLKTEVIILKSPSVLRPVFEFVKEEKIKKNKKFENWKYSDWANKSLNIGLEKGTDVLNLSYQDNDRKLILPVLEKITDAYKKYRGDSHKESMRRTLSFLDKQREIYKLKTFESLEKLQRYGLKNNLSTISLKELNVRGGGEQILHLNIEIRRDDLISELSQINLQITNLQNLVNTPAKFMLYTDEVAILNPLQLSQKLFNLENNISYQKKIYTEKDPTLIASLQARQDFYNENINKVFNILEVKKTALQTLIEGTKRQEGVLEKYKKLISNYLLNNKTLNEITTKNIELQLEIQKEPNPWKLITQPRVLDYPIGVSKKITVTIFSTLGLLIGFIVSYINEFKKRIVYNESSISKLTNSEKIIDLEIENIKVVENSLSLLSQGILNFPKDTRVSLILNEKISNKLKNSLSKVFNKVFSNINLVIADDILDSKHSDKIILITSLGSQSLDNLKELNQNLKLMNKSLDGWINIIYPNI